MDNNCVVCNEKYNKTTRKQIECDKCNFISCLSCYKNYFSSCNREASCMDCKEFFNYVFLYNNFPRNYIDTQYKQVLKNILYNNEISFFPETLPYVEQRREKEKILEKIKNLNTEIRGLYKQMDDIEVVKQYYPKKCMTSGCEGFLNTNWLCILCKTKYCKKCFEEKENIHSCLEDNVNSANLIKKETKSCPSCGISIYKIEGCDQFFCTNCNTCFDWKTLKIYDSKTRIHNPHYFEYLQKKPNVIEINDTDIENYFETNLLDQETFNYYITRWKDKNDIKRITGIKMFSNMNHFIYTAQDINNKLNDENRNIRIRFLTGEINLEQFKKEIQTKYKNNQKLQMISEKIDIFIKSINKCIINLFILKTQKKLNQDNFYEIFDIYITSVIDYKNQLSIIGKQFGCSFRNYLSCPFPNISLN